MSMYIITHKPYTPSIEADEYKLLQVGSFKGHIDADFYDDSGDNISVKNPNYCELTGLYWIWKNTTDAYVGVSHYRRYFTHAFMADKAISPAEANNLLCKYDIILPFHARYSISIADDYVNTSGKRADLDRLGVIIQRMYPDYYSDYCSFMGGRRSTLYNMMITKRDYYNSYCEWLFSILFELEKEIDLEEYNEYQKRVYGFLAERLLNVWVIHNRLKRCEVGVIPTEEKRSKPIFVITGLKRAIMYRML